MLLQIPKNKFQIPIDIIVSWNLVLEIWNFLYGWEIFIKLIFFLKKCFYAVLIFLEFVDSPQLFCNYNF